jgi:hypothetical protein
MLRRTVKMLLWTAKMPPVKTQVGGNVHSAITIVVVVSVHASVARNCFGLIVDAFVNIVIADARNAIALQPHHIAWPSHQHRPHPTKRHRPHPCNRKNILFSPRALLVRSQPSLILSIACVLPVAFKCATLEWENWLGVAFT